MNVIHSKTCRKQQAESGKCVCGWKEINPTIVIRSTIDDAYLIEQYQQAMSLANDGSDDKTALLRFLRGFANRILMDHGDKESVRAALRHPWTGRDV